MAQVIAYPFNMIQKQKLDYRTGKITSEPVGSWERFLQNSLICAGIATRWLVVCAVVTATAYGTIYAYNANLETTLEPVQTEEHIADVGKMIDTHFVVSYYVDGQRYVRKLSLATATLLEGVAKDEGVDSSVLIAMCLQESSVPNPDGWMYGCDPTAVGDNGQAHGMFQIHNAYHDISLADSRHPYYSAVWTAHRLIRKGYKYNRERAIRCHNSCSPSNDYGKRILQIAKSLKPITK